MRTPQGRHNRKRKHLTFTQADAARTAIAKTLWRVRAGYQTRPFNTLGLALRQAAAENA